MSANYSNPYEKAIGEIVVAVCASDITDPSVIANLFSDLYPELSDSDIREIAENACKMLETKPLATCASAYLDSDDDGVMSDILETYLDHASKMTTDEILREYHLDLGDNGKVYFEDCIVVPNGFEPPTVEEFENNIGTQMAMVLAGLILPADPVLVIDNN